MAAIAQAMLVITAITIVYCGCTVAEGKGMKEIVVYKHEIKSGPNRTNEVIAGTNGTASAVGNFGTVVAIDNFLTEGPLNPSKEIGRFQGLFASVDSNPNNPNFFLMASLIFHNAEYNGSTIEVFGANHIMQTVRDVPIVGGTGVFASARGLATMETLDTNGKFKITLRFRNYLHF